MPRPTCPRNVGFLPGVTFFKPAGVRIGDLKEVVLGNDELEAVRLKNLVGLSQDEAAERMNVSQPTFHRLLSSAYTKMTDAIVNGKALRIEGGNISVPEASFPVCGKGQLCAGEGRVRKGQGSTGKGQPETEKTKIAITSIDGTMEGMVDERFGRARKVILYDPASDGVEVTENSRQMNMARGAGFQAAKNVIDLGAKAVISGHLGPNAFRLLREAGVEVYRAEEMTATDALKRYREGRLGRLSEADVPEHWREQQKKDEKREAK
jgi:predicted DNA-binding protein (UPF0251 family)/predicted Fe-Mo cluster-binding NifX family protein